MNGVVLRDDFSRYGMGRMHVIRAGQPVEPGEILDEIAQRGGVVVAAIAWDEEELGMHHTYIAWRLEMIKDPMYCTGIEKAKDISAAVAFGQAVARAAEGLYRRTGQWPTRAIVRRQELPECVDLQTPEGEVMPVQVVFVDQGFQNGIVGVYKEAADGR